MCEYMYSFGRTFKNLLLKETKNPTKYYPDFESDYICICVFVSVNAQKSLIYTKQLTIAWNRKKLSKKSATVYFTMNITHFKIIDITQVKCMTNRSWSIMSDNFCKYLINKHQKNQLLLEQEKKHI